MILLRRRGLIKPTSSGTQDEYARREALVFGDYKPDTTNTGLIPGITMTETTGDITMNTANATLQNQIINGRVLLRSSGLKIKNCHIKGPVTAPASTSGNGMVHGMSSSNLGITIIEDSIIEMQAPAAGWDGIYSHSVTVKRCIIRNICDGFGVFNTNNATGPLNTQILGNIVEQMVRFYPDIGHSDGTHNDSVEVQGGSGLIIKGNVFDGYISQTFGNTNGLSRQQVSPGGAPVSVHSPYKTANAAIQFAANVGIIDDWVIENNWVYGHETGFNAGDLKIGAGTSGVCQNNKFDHGQSGFYGGTPQTGNNTVTINLDSNCTITFSNNIYEDNSVAVQIRRT